MQPAFATGSAIKSFGGPTENGLYLERKSWVRVVPICWNVVTIWSAGSEFVNAFVPVEFASGEKAKIMRLYVIMYVPMLISCGIITGGFVLAWIMNSGGIDPGPPNARI